MLRSSLGPCLGRIQQVRAVPEGDGRQEAHNVALFGWDGGPFPANIRSAARQRTFAMTNKTVCHLLKTLAALALTATFISTSFAGEFKVQQGKRYRATLSLNSVERLADNNLIERKFRALGSLECVFQAQERYVGSKVSGHVRMPAPPCHLKLLRWLDCDVHHEVVTPEDVLILFRRAPSAALSIFYRAPQRDRIGPIPVCVAA